MKKNELYNQLPRVQRMGISIWDPIWAEKEHTDPSSELVHILKGKVNVHAEGLVFHGEIGDTLIIPSGRMHRDEFRTDTPFEAVLVHFSWSNIETHFPLESNYDLVSLAPPHKQAARHKVFELYEEFKMNRPLNREITDVCLYSLLLHLKSGIAEMKHPGYARAGVPERMRRKDIIGRAKEYIQKNLAKPITLTNISDHLEISAYHLSHVFSQQSGFTLSLYITRSRMRKAAELLADPKRRVSEVAYAVGYEDPNYFGKAFRKYFEEPPGRFRTRYLSKKRKNLP